MKAFKSKVKNKKTQEDVPKKSTKSEKTEKGKEPTLSKEPTSSKNDIIVNFGKPVCQINFKRIKLFVTIALILILILVFMSIDFLITAIKIRSHLGAFINMISRGDGEILPTLLAIPTFSFLCLNVVTLVFVYKIFAKKKNPASNRILFILVLAGLVLVCMIDFQYC